MNLSNPFVFGALLNSALYLSAAFMAGLVTQHGIAWKLALATIGLTYLSHVAQLPAGGRTDWLATGLIWTTRVTGAVAGLLLLL